MKQENRSVENQKWYALRTVPEKEEVALELLKQVVPHELWQYCRHLKKRKLFRSGGALHFVEDNMFPGYLFIKTDSPEELSKQLKRAKKFPQIVGEEKDAIVPLERDDVLFLRNICGNDLEQEMLPSLIEMNDNNEIIRADGVLSFYLDKIEKLNLRKRYAIVNVDLFNRRQSVLFGICLPKDLN